MQHANNTQTRHRHTLHQRKHLRRPNLHLTTPREHPHRVQQRNKISEHRLALPLGINQTRRQDPVPRGNETHPIQTQPTAHPQETRPRQPTHPHHSRRTNQRGRSRPPRKGNQSRTTQGHHTTRHARRRSIQPRQTTRRRIERILSPMEPGETPSSPTQHERSRLV